MFQKRSKITRKDLVEYRAALVCSVFASSVGSLAPMLPFPRTLEAASLFSVFAISLSRDPQT
jgi:hypothetical protein